MPDDDLKSVPELLHAFDGDFSQVATAFARGEYLLWLGSGISRRVVPDVLDLLKQMLTYLQARMDAADPGCRFRRALDEVLDFAQLLPAEREAIDLEVPVVDWPNLEQIAKNLGDQYADVLNVPVEGEPADFLVWTGLNVPVTYGAPDIEPAAEHLCVALLMEEGVVASAPTTNWDALVERAVLRLSGDEDHLLRVIVTAADFALPDRRADLVKFHGCASRAAENEAEYRSRLIARRPQIAGWTADPSNQMMKNHLEHLLAARPALIVGLSAQDANIHTLLFQAAHNLQRPWPASPPNVVLAEPTLHRHHRLVLQATYGDDVFAANQPAIRESALLGAYATPVLLALVLYTLADKLCELVARVTELDLPPADEQRIQNDIRNLRDALGAHAEVDPLAFVTALVATVATALGIFRHGCVPADDSLAYEPLCVAPVHEALQNPDFDAAVFGRLAVAISMLGRGHLEDRWRLSQGQRDHPHPAAAYVEYAGRSSRVLIVRGHTAFSTLEKAGLVDREDDQTLVIHAERLTPEVVRSPRGNLGRKGRSGLRHVDLESLCDSETSAEELFEAFVMESAL